MSKSLTFLEAAIHFTAKRRKTCLRVRGRARERESTSYLPSKIEESSLHLLNNNFIIATKCCPEKFYIKLIIKKF